MKKYLFGALFLLYFMAPHAHAAITNGTGTVLQALSGSVATSVTISGSNPVLYVSLLTSGNNPLNATVTYNGVPMTKLWGQADGCACGTSKSWAWIMVNPPSGTNTLTVSSSQGEILGFAQPWYGVSQAGGAGGSWRTPTVGNDGGSGTTTAQETAANAVVNDMVLDSLAVYNQTPTANASQTIRNQQNNIGGNGFYFGTSNETSTSGSVTMKWTMTSTYWAYGVVPLIPATPPSVSWSAPAPNATVSSTVTLIASSTGSVSVSSTAFYVGSFGATFASSTLIGSTSTASGTQYAIPWNTTSVSNGSTTLWALATDTSNNTSTAASTTVNVENPPVISAVASSTSLTTSTITWTTNEAASSQVNYGLTSAYGSSTATSTLATSHSLLLTNLTPSTTYHFQVLSTDAQGNTSTSSDETFTTALDMTPPSVPTGLLAAATSTTEIDLSWASSTDNIGVAGYQVFRNSVQIATTTNPSYADTGLSPNTTYSYTVTAFDAAGNASAQSGSQSATTQSATPAATPETVEVAAGYKVGYPPGYIFNPTSTSGTSSQGSTAGTGSNASIEATIASLQAELETLLAEAGQGTGGGSVAPSSPYPFTRNLMMSDRGSDVQALQQFLISKDTGPAAQALATHGTTQYFGSLTYAALKEYQASVGLPATGYFGAMTRGVVESR